MKIKYLLMGITLCSAGLLAQENSATAENTAAESATAKSVTKRAVYALWKGNGAFYKGEVIDEQDGKSLIHWLPTNGSSLADEWVENSDVFGTLEALRFEKKPIREVYAEYRNGMYYKAFAVSDRDGKSLVYWADNSGVDWVEKGKVKPRKGHGLKKDWIGDRELTPAEKAKEAKANAAYAKDRAREFTAKCPTYSTQLDCMRTFDPCSWSGGRCRYRGY